MRTASFVIMMLFTAALMSTMSKAVQEDKRLHTASLTSNEAVSTAQMVAARSHDAHWTSGNKKFAGQRGFSTLAVGDQLGTSEDSDAGRVTKMCLSVEFCRKKKVICSRVCNEEHDRVHTQHIPEKCTIKCKKCIPTC